MKNSPADSPLGKPAAYVDQYDATLLFPIARAGKRAELGIEAMQPFFGADMWTAFELSWLNLRGKPQVALAHFTMPCETRNIIESKSLKLYLNSFNNTRFESADEVKSRLRADLSEAVWRQDSALGSAQQPLPQLATHPTPNPPANPPSIGVTILAADVFDREPVHELDGLSQIGRAHV